MHILMVDDVPAIRTLFINQLNKYRRFEFTEAGNGREALDVLAHTPVNLIITDWVMPEMDGLNFLYALKGSAEFCKIPVLMVTSESRPQDIGQATKAGVDGYLIKPFTSQMFVDKVESMIYTL